MKVIVQGKEIYAIMRRWNIEMPRYFPESFLIEAELIEGEPDLPIKSNRV